MSSKAPSPGSSSSNILSSSPSASDCEPTNAVREWMVIRPHVTFLHKLAAKHFPSLWQSEENVSQKNLDESNSRTITRNNNNTRDVELLAALNDQIQLTRDTANKAEEEEDETAEDAARLHLKDLKKQKKLLQAQIKMNNVSLSESPSEAASPRVRAISNVVERLIDFCNREDRKTKKVIFRVIRCHNCSQASTGGSKIGIKLALPSHHIEWMTKVRMGCAHSSVDKTMRILLEWYIAVIKVDCMMEYELLPGTEALRPDTSGFAMGLSDDHENHLHHRGRRAKGEADKALREQYERNTPIMKGYGDKDAKEFHDTVYEKSPEMEELLWKLGRGC